MLGWLKKLCILSSLLNLIISFGVNNYFLNIFKLKVSLLLSYLQITVALLAEEKIELGPFTYQLQKIKVQATIPAVNW